MKFYSLERSIVMPPLPKHAELWVDPLYDLSGSTPTKETTSIQKYALDLYARKCAEKGVEAIFAATPPSRSPARLTYDVS